MIRFFDKIPNGLVPLVNMLIMIVRNELVAALVILIFEIPSFFIGLT